MNKRHRPVLNEQGQSKNITSTVLTLLNFGSGKLDTTPTTSGDQLNRQA